MREMSNYSLPITLQLLHEQQDYYFSLGDAIQLCQNTTHMHNITYSFN